MKIEKRLFYSKQSNTLLKQSKALIVPFQLRNCGYTTDSSFINSHAHPLIIRPLAGLIPWACMIYVPTNFNLLCCTKVYINFVFCIIAAAIGKPKARVPYSSLSPSSVKNFPPGLKFGPPSSFSTKNLRCILDVAEDIEFVGMYIN